MARIRSFLESQCVKRHSLQRIMGLFYFLTLGKSTLFFNITEKGFIMFTEYNGNFQISHVAPYPGGMSDNIGFYLQYHQLPCGSGNSAYSSLA